MTEGGVYEGRNCVGREEVCEKGGGVWVGKDVGREEVCEGRSV